MIKYARLECGRSWAQDPNRSNQRIKHWVLVASLTKHAALRRKVKDWLTGMCQVG